MKAFVGISINNPYYSTKNLLNYIHYIDNTNNLNIDELAFLIGDIPYSLTYSVLKKTSISKAYQIVKNKGDDYFNLINKFMVKETGLSFKIEVIKWIEITNCKFYNTLYKKTLSLYNSNINFKNEVRNQVLINLAKKLENKRIKDFELSLLDYYILDEIAGLLTMSEFFDYKYEIYPGKDLFVLEKIISGEYKLLAKYKREFVELKFK